MKSAVSSLTPRMIALFCDRRLTPFFPPDVMLALQGYLTGLLVRREFPPYQGTRIDLETVAAALSIEVMHLRAAKTHLRPIFDAISRAVAEAELRPRRAVRSDDEHDELPRGSKKQPGRRPKVIVDFPEPLETTWDEPGDFGTALRLHAARHG